MGSVFYDKRTGTYSIRYRENGRRITKRTGERSEQKAKDILAKFETGTLKDAPTLRRLLDQQLTRQQTDIKSSTLARYEFCYRAIMAEGSPLRNITLDRIDPGVLSQYIEHRRSAKKATTHKEIKWIRAALTFAHIDGYISTETLLKIDGTITAEKHPGLKGYNRKRKRILSYREIVALRAGAAEVVDGFGPDGRPGNLNDGWQLSLYTGLRIANILMLRHRHVDRMSKILHFTEAEMKSSDEHTVYLCPVAMQIIENRLSEDYPGDPDRCLFNDFSSSWKRLVKRLQKTGDVAPDLVFQDLRRSYASFRIAAGIHPALVQDELHHADFRMTMGLYRQKVRDPETLAWAKRNFGWPHGGPTTASVEQEVAALV